MKNFSEKVSFIWSVAEILRGDYKQSDYGKVILPLTILRRLDQVLAATRAAVWTADLAHPAGKTPDALRDKMLMKASAQGYYNTSKLSFDAFSQGQIASDLTTYIAGLSKNARDIMEHFRFDAEVERLDRANLLYLVVRRFKEIDLHPDSVTNHEMGYLFEELIRRFSEQSNETAGEHFTPREVIRLMVNLLFAEDDDGLRKPSVIRTMYDPACGTGGMLSVAEDYLAELNPEAKLEVYGQELNDESYAICKADMLIKGQNAENIKPGNSFSHDGLPDLRADYLISNPPFGVDWAKAADVINAEHEKKGHAGRFGPGLPRKNDGSLLFLLHMLGKMKPAQLGGSRLAIVFNGSPLFTGGAGSGESEIRRWVIENDWLEAIIALPDQMFYNTGISTYVWIVSNRKAKHRIGKVQLINGVSLYQKMRKSLGDKRKELSKEHIADLTRLYHDFEEGPLCKIFDNEAFGYLRITVEQPLRLSFQVTPERVALLEDDKKWLALASSKKKDAAQAAAEIEEGQRLQQDALSVLKTMDPTKVYLKREAFIAAVRSAAKSKGVLVPGEVQKVLLEVIGQRDEAAEICTDRQGKPEADTDLRDNENVPLGERVDDYMKREVLPHVPDAWVDDSKARIGYEIPFTRHFYEYVPPRPLSVIEAEIRALEAEVQGMLAEVLG